MKSMAITLQNMLFLRIQPHSKLNLVLFASGDFCRLLKIFENNLDPDQDRQNVSPDLDPNCLI